ncbi:MAG: hypothetical protein WA825_01160 [Steroidobacteraceae bacterium]
MSTVTVESDVVAEARRLRLEWQARRILLDRTRFRATMILLIVVVAAMGLLSIMLVDTRLIALCALAVALAALLRDWFASRRLEAAITLLQLRWEASGGEPEPGLPQPHA